MTECERIIKEGILPVSFFEEETICDFQVTKKRKKIWAISLDLLFKFDEVCRRHNLKYSLAFGSLLGAIRHNGFIPWDDDIDVVMPRADYEKLKEFKTEFANPYFLQYPGEDEGYLFSFAKLRNSNTSGISWAFRYEGFNQGLFLDIFPLDNYSSVNIDQNMEIIARLVAESSAKMRRSCPIPDEYDRQKLAQFPIVRDVQTLSKELDNVLRQHEAIETKKYIIWSCLFYSKDKVIFDKTWFDELKDYNLYGHSVLIPTHFDKVLRTTYGDYMQFPPVEQRGTWHSSSVFNPDVPYKEIIADIKNNDK